MEREVLQPIDEWLSESREEENEGRQLKKAITHAFKWIMVCTKHNTLRTHTKHTH